MKRIIFLIALAVLSVQGWSQCMPPVGLNTVIQGVDEALLMWSINPGQVDAITGFTISGGVAPNSNAVQIPVPAIGPFQYVASNLAQGTNYVWKIAAVCGPTQSQYSTIQSFTTPTCVPPTNLASAVNPTTKVVTLTWNNPAGVPVMGYNLFGQSIGGPVVSIILGPSDNPSYVSTPLPMGNYLWSVLSGCVASGGGFVVSALAPTQTFFVPSPPAKTSGMVDPVVVNVYPNPATDIVYIDHPGDESVSVYLYDVNGRLIIEERSVEGPIRTSIDVTSLAPGVYTISVVGSTQTSSEKLIIR